MADRPPAAEVRPASSAGKRLVQVMIEEGPGVGFSWLLHTADAHGLCRGPGFAAPDHMLLERPNSARRPRRTNRRCDASHAQTSRTCLQGAFAALLAPAALSLITVTFHEPKERAKAFGVYGFTKAGLQETIPPRRLRTSDSR